jgi:ABC-type multidrug transport system ATPase subunit
MDVQHVTAPTELGGVRIQAIGVGQTVHNGRKTIVDVSFTIEPGEVAAIIGGSGVGKTTLLDALAGVRPPAQGRVLLDGKFSRRVLDRVGYLPQDDIIHAQLPLARTVEYAAKLRLPAGTSSGAAAERTEEVLASLGLAERAGQRVSLLSGGERKRASIAVELLNRPRALFLDEPTSGLDPANAAGLMRMLRRLADDGATVVFSTHNPADVELCDKMVVLGADGRLAFAGTPDQALTHFGVNHVWEIYERLGEEPPPPFVPRPQPAKAAAKKAAPARPMTAPLASGIGAARQWWVLTIRNLDILRRSALTLAILLGSPVLVLLMFLMLFQAGSFDFAKPDPATTAMILFWIAFGGFFFGVTYGLLQICGELAILRRERLSGLRLGPYVLAKVAVLLPLLAAIDAALLGVLRALDRLPDLPLADLGALYLTLVLCSAAALGLGLLCSAAVADPAQAALMLPVVCFPQVLFVGAFLPVPVMAAVGRWFSYLMSNRWAFEALGHSAGVVPLWRNGGSPLGPPLLASYGDTFGRAVWEDWLILAGFVAIFFLSTMAVLARRCAPLPRTVLPETPEDQV